MANTLEILKDGDSIAYSDGTTMPEFGKITDNGDDNWAYENTLNELTAEYDEQPMKLTVKTDGDENNSSFIVSSDSEWAKIIRNRNIIDILFDVNHDIDDRVCNIIFQHNVDADVVCVVSITQEGEIYDIKLTNVNGDEISSINFDCVSDDAQCVNDITVICNGGTGEYKIFKPRKYIRQTVGEDDETYKYSKQVAYDGALDIVRTNTGFEVCCDGALSSEYDEDCDTETGICTYTYNNNSYYEVIVAHKDILGLTASLKVEFNCEEDNTFDSIPDISSKEDNCPQIGRLEISITDDAEEPIVPEIALVDERDGELEFDYSGEEEIAVEVQTVPEDSNVYFNYYGDFIESTEITYDEETLNKFIKIKAKRNPYSLDRQCIAYIINAEYPIVRKKIVIRQMAKAED